MGYANDTASAAASSAGLPEDTLWIGEHAGDGDLLVFDPSAAGHSAEHLAFFSLAQLRIRVFPRSLLGKRIREVTDEIRASRARNDYVSREDLQAARERDQEVARGERLERQRSAVVELHQRYVEAQGLEYVGVAPIEEGRRIRSRSKCHWCGIALDDFSGSACVTCDAVVCSCGACSCGSARKRR